MAECDSFPKGGIRNQYIAVIIINILSFNHGCALSWPSPNVPILSGDHSPLGRPLTELQASLVASSFCVGAILGTPLSGWLVDRIGRKKAAMANALPFMIGWTIKLVWLHPTALICARFVAGFGGGGNLVLTPIYSSEVASLENRGILGSLLMVTSNLGIIAGYVLGDYLSYFNALAVQLSILFIFVILMSRMPESPSYLIKTNQLKEACEALAWLRRLPVHSHLLKKELNQLIHEANTSHNGNEAKFGEESVSPWKFLLKSPPSLRVLALIVALCTGQIFMGNMAVVTFAHTIFQEAGSSLSPSMSSLIIGCLQLAGSLVATSLIERLGRKILILSSCCTVVISMASLGTYFYLRDTGHDVSTIGWIPVTALSVSVSTFSMGIGPVLYVLVSEVFLVQVRGLATSIVLIWPWFSIFLITLFFAKAVNVFGSHTVFWAFAVVGCLCFIITAIFVPETKGIPIEEITAHFGGKRYKTSQTRNDEEEADLFMKVKKVFNDGVEFKNINETAIDRVSN